MESRFGADFSGVRIRDGPGAARMCNNLRARAFTRGSDIYFNSGEYNPRSRRGRHLLAHELTHVVQQRAAGPMIQRASDPAHDLTSTALSGDAKLEEIFDEQGSLGPPKKEPAVKKTAGGVARAWIRTAEIRRRWRLWIGNQAGSARVSD
jgi:hypothetical protein